VQEYPQEDGNNRPVCGTAVFTEPNAPCSGEGSLHHEYAEGRGIIRYYQIFLKMLEPSFFLADFLNCMIV
jgi:hypothetical protein